MNHEAPRDEYRLSRLGHIVEAALEYFIAIMVSGAFLARITNSLGFSDSLTGILSSFVSLGCVFQLGAVALCRRGGPVKRWTIGCQLVNEALLAVVYLSPVFPLASGQKALIFLVCFCAATILLNLIRAQKTNWMMSLVNDRARGIFTARKEIVSLLSGMIFTYAMGSMIDTLEMRGQTEQAFIAGAATLAVLAALHIATLAMIREKPPEEDGEKAGPQGLGGLIRDRMLRRIVLVGVLWNVAYYCSVPYYAPYQIKELGFSMTFISILAIVQSVVRAAVSSALGRYADRRSFSRMIYLCFIAAAAGFLVNCFTTPGNGKALFTLYNVIHAVALAGVGNAVTNLIFDCARGKNRRSALALNAALSGAAGFAATCLTSPVVALIQQNGNALGAIPLYPAQFVSALAFLIMLFLLFYTRRALVAREKQG